MRPRGLRTTARGGGCSDDDTEPVVGSKGGSRTLYVASDAGSRTVRVKANSAWQVRLTPDTRLWVSIDGADSGEMDGAFTVSYKTNNTLPRKGTVLIASGTQQAIDTVYLMQYGTAPLLQFSDGDRQFSSVGTIDSIAIDTNIPISKFSKIARQVTYGESDTEWIDSIRYAGDYKSLLFRIADNTAFESREARIQLQFEDDWGGQHLACCTIRQGIPGGTSDTREVTFADLRSLIAEAEGEITIDSDIAVSGTVVSDHTSPNMAGSPMPKAATKPDMTLNDRTAYLQNADASLGIALVTTDAGQNNLSRYDKLKLWCKGLTLTKRSDPERYTLQGVTQDHIITKSAGTAEEVPVKRRFIDQLTDADIYTFVTLKRCQMAVRTQRFMPVHINYVNNYNMYYPSVVLDRHGDMIHLMTNHGCDYRFQEMPDGEGTISGIIVHEPCTFFDKEGPTAGAHTGNVNGNGVIENGVQMCTSAGTNTDGKGNVSSEDFSAWTNKCQWWNTETDRSEAWLLHVSTEGVTTDVLSMQIAIQNRTIGGPRYIKVDWSEHGDNNRDDWNRITEFQVPDIVNWSLTQFWQCAGYKYIDIPLPLEMLGKNDICIRFSAANKKAGSVEEFDAETIGTGEIAFSYIGIRYNK